MSSQRADRNADRKPKKKKVCEFCQPDAKPIDYKNVGQLRRYLSDKGKIRSPRLTGACTKHQRAISVAIKNAREMALLPYVNGLSVNESRERHTSRQRANA